MKYQAKFKNILLILFLISLAIVNFEYLGQDDSVFSAMYDDDYYAMVINYFEETQNDDVRAIVIVFPSFAPEYVLGVKEVKGQYSIFKISPKKRLWDYRLLTLMKNDRILVLKGDKLVRDEEQISLFEKNLPKNPMEIEKNRCEVLLDTKLAKSIISVWEKMLYHIKYKRNSEIGLDGTTFLFGMKVNNQRLVGKVWSPEKDTKKGKLVAISDQMGNICQSAQQSSITVLSLKVQDLANKL